MKHFSNFNQLATLELAHIKDGRKLLPDDLSIIENASIVFDESTILWVGKTDDLPEMYSTAEITDFSDHCIVPEIVDSHTHAVFGGDRSSEYNLRLNGADYQEIARRGGGILSSMNSTRSLSADQLEQLAITRIERIRSFGVGTIEIKSGYGLDFESELKLSIVIDRLRVKFAPQVQIIRTFMAAHAIPPEFKNSEAYLTSVVIPLLIELARRKLIDQVDIFHEDGYFTSADVTLLAREAKKLSLPIKTHADEFNDNDGAALAASLNALSADHLLKISNKGIDALANSKTVGTLLPGTGLFLGKPQAPARELLDRGVKVALASDYNPGSCHFDNLLLLASIIAPQFKMNQAELWSAITLNSAHALGLTQQGALLPGLRPRFTIFKAPSLSSITYNWGKNMYAFQ
jgi:imidazolonepropionase